MLRNRLERETFFRRKHSQKPLAGCWPMPRELAAERRECQFVAFKRVEPL